ncbi:hypothetical protein ARTHRO9V_210168 [Arthrobacter sp. 9V]|nr:hypothetical protein ARTHRO9V_210168 [Arthrobacter sp. 9V]
MFQNRGHGTPNVPANTLAFYQLERELMTKALHRVDAGQPLNVDHRFGSEKRRSKLFPNLPLAEGSQG